VSTKTGYLTGYAVIRVDDSPPDHPSRVQEWMVDGEPFLTAGPLNVCVKEVVMTVEEAQQEVARLNALNVGKGCRYYWQSTHIFLDGGSHGSAGRAVSEDQGPAQPRTVADGGA
jgi:hypothetical protein